MPITMTLVGGTQTGGQLRPIVNLAFSGNYPTGGDTIDLTTIIGLADDAFIAVFSALPIAADPTLGGGFDMEFIPGSALNNCKGKIFTSGGTELAAGAYAANAALLAASLNSQIEFVFDKFL